ncbi:hypothetical protein ABIC28_002997 [Rhodococcus sp. PvR044]
MWGSLGSLDFGLMANAAIQLWHLFLLSIGAGVFIS